MEAGAEEIKDVQEIEEGETVKESWPGRPTFFQLDLL
jgi:hypothetical protein